MGSRVIRSHLVVVPIENSILDVQLRQAVTLFAHRVDQYVGRRSDTRSRIAGFALSNTARPLPITSPYSVNNPRRQLICMVRDFTLLRADTMQCQYRLLHLPLHRDRPTWLQHREPDRPRVRRVVDIENSADINLTSCPTLVSCRARDAHRRMIPFRSRTVRDSQGTQGTSLA
ncbi:hypothetical protein CBA19CS91_23695 [Paraburkholderia hospita]|nr:hypothetical protein CBA19CS91_23695 [Paraburkholderia hospita]